MNKVYLFIGIISLLLFSGCGDDTNCNGEAPCYLKVAGEKKDSSYCKYVDTTEQRDACYFTVAWKINDINACSKLSGEDRTMTKSACEEAVNNLGK